MERWRPASPIGILVAGVLEAARGSASRLAQIGVVRRWMANARRFADQMLGDQGVQDQQNDARDEEEEQERGVEVEFRPEVVALGTARWLCITLFDAVLRQADDGAVGMKM